MSDALATLRMELERERAARLRVETLLEGALLHARALGAAGFAALPRNDVAPITDGGSNGAVPPYVTAKAGGGGGG